MINVSKDVITIGLLSEITGGIYHGSDKEKLITNISTDSRDIGENTVFIALKGEIFDGHDFIESTLENGAVCVISEKSLPGNVIVVEDTYKALADIAQFHKRKINPLTVAVTGSVGKTTTKEFIYYVVAEKYHAFKSEGNFNNEVGVPKTMLRMGREFKALVLEMAMRGKGEIGKLSLCAEPDIAVITNIGMSHIELLGSKENIRDAKLEILQGLKPSGKLILNGDDEYLKNIPNAIYVAFNNPEAKYIIHHIRKYYGYTIFSVNDTNEIRIPTIGEHNVFDAAVAYAVGREIGMDDEQILKGLNKFKHAAMRQNIYIYGGFTVIDDCYNASPDSMKAAIKVLRRYNRGKKIAVLGDMLELGTISEEMHKQVGKAVTENNIDVLFTFGESAANIAVGALESGFTGEIYKFNEINDLNEKIKQTLNKGDTILFKASRAMKLECTIKYLKGE
ncbi:MAG: UDP-N-acetylmuramoyl-tripeptide--D-alanyl-D-alanine ligase [Oscillospiraceae bacterium]|nr:UDP-N-acetylmuramoyl-tripeptide--D-alanyl-D-alanine ligase [Oscillospiraceae bacterium]